MRVLKRLNIKNFLWTKSREVDFDMLDPLVFIVWENAGWKTTIMRAIYLALTWEDAFFWKNKLDWLINDHANEMVVELELANKWNDYKIVVKKLKNKALDIDVYENGKSLLESKLNKEAKDILSNLFWNPTSILSTYFIFGDNKSDFVENTPMWRLQIITKVSDAFQKYEDISTNAKWFVKKLELEKNQKIGQLELASRNVLELDEKINTFNKIESEQKLWLLKSEFDILNNSKKIKTDILEIEQKLSVISNIDVKSILQKLEDNKKAVLENEKINIEIKEQELLKETINNDYNSLNLEFTKHEWLIKNIETNINTNKSFVKELDQDILSKYTTNIEETNERLEKWKVALETKLKEWTEFKSQIEFNQKEIVNLNNSLKEQNQLLKDAEDLFNHNTTCPLCHNDLTEKSLTNYKKFVNTEIDKLNEKIVEVNKKIVELESAKKQVGEDYVKYKKIVDELTIYIQELKKKDENDKVINKNKELEKELDTLKSELLNKSNLLNNKKDELNKIVLLINEKKSKLLPTMSNSEIDKQNDILKLNEKSSTLEEQKQELIKKLTSEIENISLSELSNKINELDREINIINSTIINYNSNIERLNTEKSKETNIKNEIEGLSKNIEQYEDIQKLFWKDWIQKRQIQMLLWEIEVETNALIKKFFDNVWVKFWYDNKWIDLKILRRVDYNDGSYEQKEDVIWNFSDAQQEVLKVLLKLSFSKVVQNLNNTPLNILFLNETFNTLSKDKEPILVDILNYYNRSYHIAFITHNADLIGNYGWNNIYNISD